MYTFGTAFVNSVKKFINKADKWAADGWFGTDVDGFCLSFFFICITTSLLWCSINSEQYFYVWFTFYIMWVVSLFFLFCFLLFVFNYLLRKLKDYYKFPEINNKHIKTTCNLYNGDFLLIINDYFNTIEILRVEKFPYELTIIASNCRPTGEVIYCERIICNKYLLIHKISFKLARLLSSYIKTTMSNHNNIKKLFLRPRY